MGYSDTGASPDLRDYSFKTHADAVGAIVRELGGKRVVLGGHDWGGMAVYRVAQWLGREVVGWVFSVCTGFVPVMERWVSFCACPLALCAIRESVCC